MTLYSLRTALDDYRITKFDADLNVESSYLLSPIGGTNHGFECECPAGTRPTCRHRQMLPAMIDAGICDTEWFYDFERKLVVDTNGNLRPRSEPAPLPPGDYTISTPNAGGISHVVDGPHAGHEVRISNTSLHPWRRL